MRRTLQGMVLSSTGLCPGLMTHTAFSSQLLPTQLRPWLLRDWPIEAQGPVMCSVSQSCPVLGAWCQADPALEQVLAGSSGIEGKRMQQAEERAHACC